MSAHETADLKAIIFILLFSLVVVALFVVVFVTFFFVPAYGKLTPCKEFLKEAIGNAE